MEDTSGANRCCDNIEKRASKVAQRIKALDLDVVALNEVFDDGERLALVDALKSTYPSIVKILRANINLTSSGLMLFSKWPFVTLPNPVHRAPPEFFYPPVSDGVVWNDVAFIEYDDSNGFGDSVASKGVGLVRIRHPDSTVFTVAFSHTDAGDEADDVTARRAQMRDVKRIVEDTLGTTRLRTEPIFIMGDLNIRGSHLKDRTEWTALFGNATTFENGFFRSTVHDAWEFEVQPALPGAERDPGLTAGIWYQTEADEDPMTRYDYLLRNDAGLAVQHLAVARGLRHGAPYQAKGPFWKGADPTGSGGGYQDLSDHYGLVADVNLAAPGCSTAAPFADFSYGTWLTKTIEVPGRIHWFRLDGPGTYTLEVVESTSALAFVPGPPVHVTADFYTTTEISQPVSVAGDAGLPLTWHNPDPHGWVRVSGLSRTWTGSYSLRLHRHRGLCPADAIGRYPNLPEDGSFGGYPDGQAIWFRLQTEKPDTGAAQRLRFFATTLRGEIKLQLRSADGVLITETAYSDHPEIVRSNSSDNDRTLFLVAVRKVATEHPLYTLGWETSLTVMHGTPAGRLRMTCIDQTELGIDEDDDDVKLTIRTDGDPAMDSLGLNPTMGSAVEGALLEENFDEDQLRGIEDKVQVVRFTDRAVVLLNEEDADPNPNDILRAKVGPLSAGEPGSAAFWQPVQEIDGPGNYRFFYHLSHGLRLARPADLSSCTPVFQRWPKWGIWQRRHFTAGELEYEAVSGDAADPDGDSQSNIVEWIFDTDPRDPSNTRPARPFMGGWAFDRSGGAVEFILPDAAVLEEAAVPVQTMDADGRWGTVADMADAARSPLADGSTRFTFPIPPSLRAQARSFFRFSAARR